MTAPELQQRFVQAYDRARWLDTLRQILPSTQVFATPQSIPDAGTRAESILQLGKISLSGGRNLAVLEVRLGPDTDLPANRAALRHLVARYIDQAEYHGVFAIFYQQTGRDYRFTFAAREAAFDSSGELVRNETAPRRYTYLLGPNESCRTAAERFELLARKGSDATIADVRAAFDKEPLTREFFKRFEAAIDTVKTDLEKYQALPSAQAYSRAQLLLERLLFLYFVQNRGWLDQKRNFLLDHFTAHRAVPNAYTYYSDFLERVFFTLSTPPDFSGPGSRLRFDGLPFLNGGLFDDDEFAQTPLRRADNPPLHVRNATFADVFADLLEAFNFTAHEDTPLDQDVAVDPEMLGKVFESIVLHAEAADPDAIAPDKRKATGSYYTPRIVVHFICRESLCLYLLNHLSPGLNWPVRLRALLEIATSDGLDDKEFALLKTLLSPEEGRRIGELIANLKCCDPSVGSGAFPVGLLQELLNLHRLVETASLGYVDPVRKHGNEWVHKTKAHIVENCLYGVDIQQQAIEICRLRLWLSLVVDYDLGCDPLVASRHQFLEAIRNISQLPNLEMNFRRGDSLLDMVSGVPIRVEGGVVSRYRDDVAVIQKLGHDLHKARKADRKKKLRLEILSRRLDFTQRVLQDERGMLLGNQQVGDLFEDAGSDANKRRVAQEQVEQIDLALKKLTADRRDLDKLAASPLAANFYPRLRKLEGADFDSPFNFVWHIDFAEIFHPQLPAAATLAGELAQVVNSVQRQQELVIPTIARGGFDLMVGNPPFVTARNPVKRELYRKRWSRVSEGQYQLVCPFFELSFSLLTRGGQLGFIVSNAFTKREFGKPLIENLFRTVDLQKVIDCSGLLFPGHGTPTCIALGSADGGLSTNPIIVTALLPGGGDLRTPPEESSLWATIAAQHENPGYKDSSVAVYSWPRKRFLNWPMSFDLGADDQRLHLESINKTVLGDLINGSIGRVCFTGADELYFVDEHLLRRLGITPQGLARFAIGDLFRNWTHSETHCLCPYDGNGKLISDKIAAPIKRYLSPWRQFLEERLSYGETQLKRGNAWWEYSLVFEERIRGGLALCICEIATHIHVEAVSKPFIANRANPIFELQAGSSEQDVHLIAAGMNSSTALFWLKQICYNKGAGEDEDRDRFEFAGGKVEQLPMPIPIAAALRGKQDPLSARLHSLSYTCWNLGQQLQSFALAAIFESADEAYNSWNISLLGHVAPNRELIPPFITTAQLRTRFDTAVKHRERVRAEMIALQEEMDWLVYRAYGLGSSLVPNALVDWITPDTLSVVPPITEDQRPFRFWAAMAGDFQKACALIPADWSEPRRKLWHARLQCIRDDEHIRRIEAPVYKRRWDEQWKVSNRWMSGPVAYAQELVDAFRWWLAEKAEWHLEHNAKGPLSFEAWSTALAGDPRIEAAWPVVAEAIHRLELWKIEHNDKKSTKPPKLDGSSVAFTRLFKEMVNDETVPEGIPPAVPWDELAKKGIKVSGNTKSIRGKLNVPRERFTITATGHFRQAKPI
jgi:hypothetical protein